MCNHILLEPILAVLFYMLCTFVTYLLLNTVIIQLLILVMVVVVTVVAVFVVKS